MDDQDDDDPGLAGLSPEFQAMLGGLAGHTASFGKMLEKRANMSKESARKKDDDVYLESYADLSIHEDMLKDIPRVEAYSKAIAFYGTKWTESADTTVIDVGSGTGLLAIKCAQAGAKKVIAVEASRMSHFLKQIVTDNSLSSCVEVYESRAEELELPEVKAVDVIVSEWMGYFLLFENMLPSVLAVRDKYLKPNGLMLPSRCRLMVAPVERQNWRNAKLDFWKEVHGIDMSALMPLAVATACERPQHCSVSEAELLGHPIPILDLDLHKVREEDLKRFEMPICFEMPPGKRLDGFASWFECDFGEDPSLLSLLSTSPSSPPTHWRQTVFHFRQPLEGGGGVSLSGKVVVEQHEVYSRGYRITFELNAAGRRPRLETFELR